MEDNKRVYEEPTLEMVVLGQSDIITESGCVDNNETPIVPIE